MQRTAFILAMVGAGMAGCQAAPVQQASTPEPPFYVPTALLVDAGSGRGINPYQVLPASGPEEYFIGRAEKFLYGSTYLDQYSAYTIYTYDAQRISVGPDTGYRYTNSVRQGISSP